MMIKLSVIVPAYNVSSYIEECLKSLHKQTLTDAEFIVVDDGSTDGTSEICDRYAAKDSRFVVLHQPNKGPLMARKAGIEQSHGKWVTFLDGDDTFAREALVQLLQLAEETNVDILQFSIKICWSASFAEAMRIRDWYKIKKEHISGGINLAKATFRERIIPWNLWGKIYRGNMIRKLFSYTENSRSVWAEDSYIFFLCCYFASSFAARNTKPLYNYRFGAGISGKRQTFQLYEKQVRSGEIIGWLKQFLASQNASSDWYDYLEDLGKYLSDEAVSRLVMLEPEYWMRCFCLVNKYHNLTASMSWLQNVLKYKLQELYSSIISVDNIETMWKWGEDILQVSGSLPRTVGLLHQQDGESSKKCLNQTIFQLQKLGMKVVLLCDQGSNDNTITDLSANCCRVTLPPEYANGRAQVLQKIVAECKIDFIFHFTILSRMTVFDLLFFKNLNIPVMLCCHETIASFLDNNMRIPHAFPAICLLASRVITTSHQDAFILWQYGVNAVCPEFGLHDSNRTDPLLQARELYKKQKSVEARTALKAFSLLAENANKVKELYNRENDSSTFIPQTTYEEWKELLSHPVKRGKMPDVKIVQAARIFWNPLCIPSRTALGHVKKCIHVSCRWGLEKAIFLKYPLAMLLPTSLYQPLYKFAREIYRRIR